MMAYTNTILGFATMAMISLQGVELADLVIGDSLPPPIEGVGAVRGTVKAGETVTVDWIITKRTSCNGVSGRYWSTENGFSMNEPLKATALPVTLGPASYKIPTKIPSEVKGSEVTLEIIGWYECPNDDKEYFRLGPVVIQLEGGSDGNYPEQAQEDLR